MKTAGNIASLLGIEAGEHRMVASMMGHFFLIGISRVYVMAPAYGLFLEEFSASTLPYVYLLVSILATLTAIGYLRLADRIPFRGLLVVNLAFIAATTILLRVGLDFPSREWVIFALPIWFEILWILTNLEFWSLAGRLFDVRQGKRLFGLLMAGRMSSEIVCGFLTPLLVLLIGTANLLLISAAATCLTIFALFRVTRTFRHRFEAAEETTGQSGGQRKHSFIGLLKGRYVLLLFGQAVLGCVAYYFVDTIFYDRSAAQFPDTDRLASFLGVFTGAYSGFCLIGSLFLTGPILKRFGAAIAIVMLPGLVLLAILFLSASNLFSMDLLIVFAAAVAAKFFYSVFANVTDIPATNVFYQPMPAHERAQILTATEGIIGPFSGGLAGILLLLLTKVFGIGVVSLGYFLLPVMVGWVITSSLLGREYPNQIKKILGRRILSDVKLESLDERATQVLAKNLDTDNPTLVRYCLNVLEEGGDAKLDDRLIALTEHHHAAMRAEAFGRIERRRVQAARPTVHQAMEHDDDPKTRGAALRAVCALEEGEVIEEVKPYLDAPSTEVRVGAMTGLFRYGGIPGIVAASETFGRLSNSSDPRERCLAARVIGEVGNRSFYAPLIPFLNDKDVDTRRAALTSARRVGNPRLIPATISNLAEVATRSWAAAALMTMSEDVLPEVEKGLIDDQAYPDETVIRLLRICSEKPSDNLRNMLVTHLLHPNGDIQFRILKALHRCGFRAGESRAEIERGMSRTLKRACTILRTRAELGDESALDPLRRALAFEEEQTREKLFLFLSFIYDAQGILGAETKLKWGGPADRALAIESLDVALAPEHKTFVLPLVDPQTTGEQKLEALRHSVEVPVKATEDRLHEIIRDEEGSWGHGWTQACALYAAGKMNLTNLAGLVEDALIRSAHPIRETAAWALYSLDRARFEEHRAALSRDDNPHVAQLARRLTTS